MTLMGFRSQTMILVRSDEALGKVRLGNRLRCPHRLCNSAGDAVTQARTAKYAYSKGYVCEDCGVKVSNNCKLGRCRKCRGLSIRGARRGIARTVTHNGYIELHGFYDHPNADKRGTIKEHIMVMSNQLGRKLLSHENVHHKNGDRSDNRLVNLELWSTSQPKGQRIADKVEWARELLETYKDWDEVENLDG